MDPGRHDHGASMIARTAPLALLAILSCNAETTPASGSESTDTSGGGSTGVAPTDTTTETIDSTTVDSSSESSGTGNGTAVLRGGVQKGPLLLGSSVSAARLDASGEPTGEVFGGQLDDDRGRFDLGDVPSGPYLIEADGFHYDEVRGALSGAPIVLRAVVSLPTGGDIYVNAFTHLAHRRVLMLLAEGEPIDDAIAQAEQAVAVALPIGVATTRAPTSGTDMTLLDGDDAAGRYLFATSALFGQAATDAAGGGQSDAYLQQRLNEGASELGDTGVLDASTEAALIAALLALDVAVVEANLGARLLELGIDEPVPRLDLVLDQDRDGILNEDDVCDLVVDPAQLDGDADGIGDACDQYLLGDPVEIVGGLDLPWSFAVTPEWIYYTNFGDPAVDDGALWRVATAGGEPELVDASVEPRDVAASSTAAWWIHLDGISQAPFDAATTPFVDTFGRSLVVNDTALVWVTVNGGVYRSALDVAAPQLLATGNGAAYEAAANDDTFYWTTSTTVEAVRIDGSESWTVAAEMQFSSGIAADATDVVWIDLGACTIYRAPADGGAVDVVWASDDPNDVGPVCAGGATSQLALDDTHVYWGGQEELSRVLRDGGEREMIADGDAVWLVRDIHVDDDAVYWVNHTGAWSPDEGFGSLMRMSKPR